MGCYNFRMLNGSPRVTSKKVAIEYTQKEMRKEFKCFTRKKSTKNKIRKKFGEWGTEKLLRHMENCKMKRSFFLSVVTLNVNGLTI